MRKLRAKKLRARKLRASNDDTVQDMSDASESEGAEALFYFQNGALSRDCAHEQANIESDGSEITVDDLTPGSCVHKSQSNSSDVKVSHGSEVTVQNLTAAIAVPESQLNSSNVASDSGGMQADPTKCGSSDVPGK